MLMTFSLSVNSDFKKLTKRLNNWEKKQLPFALAVGLTKTAKDAQAQVKRDIPKHFKLRRQWIVKGIRIVPAKKRKPFAIVYSKDRFMVEQEFGGTRAKNKQQVVPTDNAPKGLKIGRRGKARTVRGLFRIKGGLYVRRGRGKNRKPVKVATLTPRVKVAPRLGMRDTVAVVVHRRFPIRFAVALRKALRSARWVAHEKKVLRGLSLRGFRVVAVFT